MASELSKFHHDVTVTLAGYSTRAVTVLPQWAVHRAPESASGGRAFTLTTFEAPFRANKRLTARHWQASTSRAGGTRLLVLLTVTVQRPGPAGRRADRRPGPGQASESEPLRRQSDSESPGTPALQGTAASPARELEGLYGAHDIEPPVGLLRIRTVTLIDEAGP